MTKATTGSRVPPVTAPNPQPTPATKPECSHEPVLITEQQVRFATATAAAAPAVRRSPTQWLVAMARAAAVITGLRASEAEAHANGLVPPRHYPSRWPSYLEHACMAREMDRL